MQDQVLHWYKLGVSALKSKLVSVKLVEGEMETSPMCMTEKSSCQLSIHCGIISKIFLNLCIRVCPLDIHTSYQVS